jgi:hypothetical protein
MYVAVGSLVVSAVHPPFVMPDASEILVLSLMKVWNRSTISDVAASLNVVPCRPLRLLHLRLLYQGHTDALLSEIKDGSKCIICFHSSCLSFFGESSGGSVMRVAIENFPWSANMALVPTSADVKVSFGDKPPLSNEII